MSSTKEPSDRPADFRQKYLNHIREVCLMDDDFFQVCFQNDKACTELVLRIIMQKEDLHILEAQTQHTITNLAGHSVRLDMFATDSDGIQYDIEIQNSAGGAVPKRARYNSSLIDGKILLPNQDYRLLPETYVIFITRNDVLQKGLPISHIDRRINETGDEFGDGSHIIYVNAEIADNSPLGKLMYDFTCTEPKQMNYKLLAEKTGHFKYEHEGVNHMCDFLEELRQDGRKEAEEEARAAIAEARNQAAEARNEAAEARNEVAEAKNQAAEAKNQAVEARAEIVRQQENARKSAVKNAFKMLLSGKLTLDEIAEYTSLPLDEVKEFAAITSGAQ